MIDDRKQGERREEKERVRMRMHARVNPDKYDYYPEKEQLDLFDENSHWRVGIYVRVSTDDVKQTTSYELQKRYYEEFVAKHSEWTLVEIYADATCIIGTNQSPSEWAAICPYFSCFPSIWRRHTR